MFCTACGTENPPGSRFCANCGAALPQPATGGVDVTRTVAIDEVGPDDAIYDIGPMTASYYGSVVKGARTVLWNGPMGMFEVPAFAQGTISVAKAVAEASQKGTVSVVGGGDSVAAIEEAGVADQITHVSTGGGASLEFLEGRTLPGVAALRDKQ